MKGAGVQIWRTCTVTAYLGMIMAALLVTAVLPLVVINLGERRSVAEIAARVDSFKRFSHWLIGIGAINFTTCSLALLASFSKSKKFHIVTTIGIIISLILTVALMIWGLVDRDSKKTYFHDFWKEAAADTKNLLQDYYSCCGFESVSEYTKLNKKVNETCYANNNQTILWTDGCFNRITSLSLAAPNIPGTDKNTNTFHVFLVAFVVSFVVMIAILFSTALSFIIGIFKFPKAKYQSEKNGSYAMDFYVNGNAQEANSNTVDENGHATDRKIQKEEVIETIDRNMENGGSNGTKSAVPEISQSKSVIQQIPDAISSTFEAGFYWLGKLVGVHPKLTIVLSLFVSLILMVGLLQRREQPPGGSNFLSRDAPIIEEFASYRRAFPFDGRDQVILVVDDGNLLTAEKFKVMLEIDRKVREIRGAQNQTFEQMCLKIARRCQENSVFEFWDFNRTIINQLTDEDILEKLNGDLTSPVFQNEVDLSTLLGGISGDGTKTVARARAHKMQYVIRSKDDAWERAFIEVGRAKYPGVSVYVESRGSRTFEARGGYQRELPFLFAGFGLIFIYIILMTGRFSLFEHRTYVALMGIVTAGLSMGAGIGLAGSLGFEWSVLHLVAPFLVIGIGVDDMFILIQSWNTVEDDPETNKLPLAERAGHALKSAGVSITVTSVTDLVAFAVGASSELTPFASFSVYVAICIILLFLLQCTFFLACTVLDQRRREQRYDACLACCYQHDENYTPNKCSNREFFATFFEDVLGSMVQRLPVQLGVILATLALTSVMAWAFSILQVNFDPDWYLPQESYLIPYGREFGKYFSSGQEADVFVTNSDFFEEREKLHDLYLRLRNNDDVNQKSIVSWFERYVSWCATDKNITDIYAPNAFTNSAEFYSSVMEFLRGKGSVFFNDVTFEIQRNFSRLYIPRIIGSRFHIRHRNTEKNIENADIMDHVHADCQDVGFSGSAFPFHRVYFNYNIMKIIRDEVYRNLGITLLCVFIMVLPMIASLQMSFWVLLCVVFTIVDVAGSMHFAGLTIETSTIITLLLSVGLAVDYAAHIAHKFLTLKGSRAMRARVTLGQLGTAVFNGGFSTFLALVLLAGTDTYSYKVFFTVFVCVVGYGLWNGLVFLPCVLALVGPAPHATAVEAKLSQRHHTRKSKVKSVDDVRTTEYNSHTVERT